MGLTEGKTVNGKKKNPKSMEVVQRSINSHKLMGKKGRQKKKKKSKESQGGGC